MDYNLNTLGLSHKVIADFVSEGSFCIDATAGNGKDTEFLCRLVGSSGSVLALDIQNAAVTSTRKRLESCGLSDIAKIVCDCHSNMLSYAEKDSADAVMFNLGWLPGGDHMIFSKPETTIKAIKSAMEIIKPGGVISICIYYGKECGYEERDALLEFFPTIDNITYTVLVSNFVNRKGDVPIPVFIFKNRPEK